MRPMVRLWSMPSSNLRTSLHPQPWLNQVTGMASHRGLPGCVRNRLGRRDETSAGTGGPGFFPMVLEAEEPLLGFAGFKSR